MEQMIMLDQDLVEVLVIQETTAVHGGGQRSSQGYVSTITGSSVTYYGGGGGGSLLGVELAGQWWIKVAAV
jgi:hypothetical protein